MQATLLDLAGNDPALLQVAQSLLTNPSKTTEALRTLMGGMPVAGGSAGESAGGSAGGSAGEAVGGPTDGSDDEEPPEFVR